MHVDALLRRISGARTYGSYVQYSSPLSYEPVFVDEASSVSLPHLQQTSPGSSSSFSSPEEHEQYRTQLLAELHFIQEQLAAHNVSLPLADEAAHSGEYTDAGTSLDALSDLPPSVPPNYPITSVMPSFLLPSTGDPPADDVNPELLDWAAERPSQHASTQQDIFAGLHVLQATEKALDTNSESPIAQHIKSHLERFQDDNPNSVQSPARLLFGTSSVHPTEERAGLAVPTEQQEPLQQAAPRVQGGRPARLPPLVYSSSLSRGTVDVGKDDSNTNRNNLWVVALLVCSVARPYCALLCAVWSSVVEKTKRTERLQDNEDEDSVAGVIAPQPAITSLSSAPPAQDQPPNALHLLLADSVDECPNLLAIAQCSPTFATQNVSLFKKLDTVFELISTQETKYPGLELVRNAYQMTPADDSSNNKSNVSKLSHDDNRVDQLPTLQPQDEHQQQLPPGEQNTDNLVVETVSPPCIQQLPSVQSTAPAPETPPTPESKGFPISSETLAQEIKLLRLQYQQIQLLLQQLPSISTNNKPTLSSPPTPVYVNLSNTSLNRHATMVQRFCRAKLSMGTCLSVERDVLLDKILLIQAFANSKMSCVLCTLKRKCVTRNIKIKNNDKTTRKGRLHRHLAASSLQSQLKHLVTAEQIGRQLIVDACEGMFDQLLNQNPATTIQRVVRGHRDRCKVRSLRKEKTMAQTKKMQATMSKLKMQAVQREESFQRTQIQTTQTQELAILTRVIQTDLTLTNSSSAITALLNKTSNSTQFSGSEMLMAPTPSYQKDITWITQQELMDRQSICSEEQQGRRDLLSSVWGLLSDHRDSLLLDHYYQQMGSFPFNSSSLLSPAVSPSPVKMLKSHRQHLRRHIEHTNNEFDAQQRSNRLMGSKWSTWSTQLTTCLQDEPQQVPDIDTSLTSTATPTHYTTLGQSRIASSGLFEEPPQPALFTPSYLSTLSSLSTPPPKSFLPTQLETIGNTSLRMEGHSKTLPNGVFGKSFTSTDITGQVGRPNNVTALKSQLNMLKESQLAQLQQIEQLALEVNSMDGQAATTALPKLPHLP